MANAVAPEGQVYLCAACGKQSKDKYGEQRISHGWDVSCMMNSVLVYEDSIVYENGKIKSAKAVEESDDVH
jgi:hypothetical protein